MFAFIFAVIKGVVISALLCIGCVLLGRAINKRFSPTIVHYIVMLAVVIVTCILIVSYSLTSSLKSTVEEYGSLAINITNLPASINIDAITSNAVNGNDYVESVVKAIGNEYPLIAGQILKLTAGNTELQSQVNTILSSNATDKTAQIVNCVTISCYQGILDKLFWVKFKILAGIVLVQLIQIVMVFMAVNKSTKKKEYIRDFELDYQ